MTREPIEVTRQDRIYCLKVSSDYHSEVCEECRFYPNCDHMTQDDMTELTIKDLETLEQEPTTKNDLAQERYQDLIDYFGDEKVAKIILENRGQFKAWLERLRWHVKRADELARELEQIKGTTKNDLTVDCISREQAKVAIRDKFKDLPSRVEINTILNTLPSVTPQLSSELEKNSKKLEKDFGELDCISRAEMLKYQEYLHGKMSNEENHKLWKFIKALPSVTPQPRKGHWIFDGDCLICSKCKKAYTFSGSNYCPNCGADMRGEEE